MASSSQQAAEDQPRFSFGSMALTEETGRQPALADIRNQASEADDASPTLNEAIDILRMTSLNEHFCPEILKFQPDTVDVIRTLVNQQTDDVDEEEDENGDALSFEAQLKRMEIDRINYLLRDYLRVRVKKIEKSVLFIFKDSNTYDLLSRDEQKFAVGFMDMMEEHLKKSFLSMLPKRVQIFEKDGNVDFSTGPNLDKFVFCRVRNSVGSYAVGEEANDDPLDLNQGDILCIRYKSIQELLIKEDVELI